MTSTKVQTYRKAALWAIPITGLLASTVAAKNGFLPHGIGSQFGMGGAGTALAVEATNANENPSVLTRIDTQISASFVNFFQSQYLDSSRALAGNPIGIQKNQLTNSPGGALGGNYTLNKQWAFGVATNGGGSNIKYKSPTLNPALLSPNQNNTFNNEFINTIMLVNPTVSYQRTPCDSYGFSLILGYQTLKNNLATSAFTQTQGALRVDTATGIGARIGGLWDINKTLSFGASASTPVKFSSFKKYLDVLPRSFDVPGTVRLGLALHVGKTDYLFDVKEIFYSKVKALGDSLGWKNQTVFMIGLQHQLMECLVLSAGYNHGNSPVRSNNVLLNSLSIPIAQHHFTAGTRYKASKNWEMSLGAEFTPNVRMIDDGTGVLGVNARGARVKTKDVGVLLGVVYHFC